ncbi:MAG: amidohydrolase family protein [Alphaproteobacteria bacterium]
MLIKNGQIMDVLTGDYHAHDIRVTDGRIAEIGHGLAADEDDTIDAGGAYLLPGFVDCHVHICVNTESANPNNPWRDALPGTIAVWAARAAKRMLHCGITTAREVGGWDYHEIAVRNAINAGWINGPRLFCAGRILTMTTASTPYFKGMYEEADGADAVRHAARKQLAQGADLIKVMASGAITSSEYESADAIQYRPDELQAAVEIATDNFKHVAAHAHCNAAIMNAARAGCRTVEHAALGTRDAFVVMKEHGTILIPTLCTISAMFADEAFAARVPDHVRAEYARVEETRIAAMNAAREVGVKIAMGTDVGTPANHAGDNMQELEVMVNSAGFSPLEAIHSATVNGAGVVDQGDRLGQITEGRLADIIACREDPLKNISALRDVCFVMKDGKVFRDDHGFGPGVVHAGL